MIETAAAIEALPLPERAPAARDDVAAGFSFAAALSALEARAAQSLETFGGAPKNASPAGAKTPSQRGQQTAPQNGQAAEPQTESAPDARRAGPGGGSDARAEPTRATAPTAPTANPLPAAAAVPAAPAQAGASAALKQIPAPTARVEAPLPAKPEAIKANALRAARAPQAPQTPASAQDFARLLARRLDSGATSFELRLDPPSLGRVEAQLKVGDGGDAVLALKFEHQAALDLFAQDEAGLRLALASSGFDLGGERLAFSLAEETAPGEAAASLPGGAPAAVYEPLFLAPYSQGAVDLRI